MKYVKMLGLAAVAAMALMAFIGASSASATVLCKTTTTPCGAANHYSTGTTLDASLKAGTTATLTNTSESIVDTCTESTVEGVTSNTGSGSETVTGSVTTANLTWGGCTRTTTTTEGGELEIHHIEGTDHGTVTAKKFEVTINIVGVTCTFGAGEGKDLGTLTGGKDPIIDISVVVNKITGSFLCPSDATWNAEYTVTTPNTAIYVEPS